MKIRPLGWELATVLVGFALLALTGLLGSEEFFFAVLVVLTFLTPLILISAGIRLIAAIVEEDRRYRLAKSMRRLT